MTFHSRSVALTATVALALSGPLASMAPAYAGGGYEGGGHAAPAQCAPGAVTINKSVSINKSIVIDKPVTIAKSIAIDNSVNISKNVSIQKSIDLSKNISINKTININKGGAKADASAAAMAFAFASARASAVSYGGGSYIAEAAHSASSGDIGGASAQTACVEQWATVVKAVHAICVDHWGHEHPATHMRPETWVDSSYSGEIYRCLEGSSLHAVIGHVVQNDEGTAAVYEGGDTLGCKAGEALRHFAGGLVKCAVAERVPDCTERTNLRRYGAGDIFFSFREKICAPAYSASSEGAGGSALELSGMSLSGGVGN